MSYSFARVVAFVGRGNITQQWVYEYEALAEKKRRLLYRRTCLGIEMHMRGLMRLQAMQWRVDVCRDELARLVQAERLAAHRMALDWKFWNRLLRPFMFPKSIPYAPQKWHPWSYYSALMRGQ